MRGQIELNSDAGKFISQTCARNDVSTIVEIGTWEGGGSTQCALQGIKDTDKIFFIIECCLDKYKIALEGKPESKNVHYLFGRIIEEEELDKDNLGPHEEIWIKDDIKFMSECPNVFNLIPNQIDFLILDGGEFSTRSEFLKLKDRAKIIFLDDTACRKNILNCSELSTNVNYKTIINSSDRNGWAVFERISK
tara:strand:+ start:4027 stop:4605 length:579 start_codon:yes stop_codon:yes gene_type:complete